MPSQPVISVIVPHFNQQLAVGRLLESLDMQREPGIPFEVIVCDNGSAMPLPKGVASHPLVTVVHESQPGPGPARNRGVTIARGQILAFIDADCTAGRNWIRTIFSHFHKPDSTNVIGGDVRIKQRGALLEPIEAYESIFGYRFALYIRRDGYAGTGNLAMRREVFDAVGPFGPIQIAEDRDWGQRATRAGFPPAYLPEMIIYTESREDLSELARKWDRHIAHEFAEVHGFRRKIAWVLRSMALFVSPIAEIPRVLTSRRIGGSRARVLAWGILVRIRMYRSKKMLQLLLRKTPDEMALRWRKK